MNFFSEVSHTHTHAHTQTGLEATRVDFRLFGEYCNVAYHSLPGLTHVLYIFFSQLEAVKSWNTHTTLIGEYSN